MRFIILVDQRLLKGPEHFHLPLNLIMLLQPSAPGSLSALIMISFLIRIIGMIVCYNQAKALNRNVPAWVCFGFIMPVVAMVWVNCLKPRMEFGKTERNYNSVS